jgi:hypothetical protein
MSQVNYDQQIREIELMKNISQPEKSKRIRVLMYEKMKNSQAAVKAPVPAVVPTGPKVVPSPAPAPAPVGPNARKVVPPPVPVGPNARKVVPAPVGPNASKVVPAPVPVGPNASKVVPAPVGPNVAPFVPTGKPVQPPVVPNVVPSLTDAKAKHDIAVASITAETQANIKRYIDARQAIMSSGMSQSEKTQKLMELAKLNNNQLKK